MSNERYAVLKELLAEKSQAEARFVRAQSELDEAKKALRDAEGRVSAHAAGRVVMLKETGRAAKVLISNKSVQARLGVGDVTLWRWRREGYGPQWCKMGSKVMYDLDSVEEFINCVLSENAVGDPRMEQ